MWATRPNPNLGKRGAKGWPKNVPRPQSTRDNIKKSLKEKFPNGRIAPNKGKKQTPEQIAANSECHKGMFGMINDSTKERKFCRAGTSIPDGWTRIPSRMSWIHNSETKESIQILAKQPIPEGWVRGKFGGSFKDNHKNKIRICNPLTGEEKFHPKELPVPNGWELGMIKGRKKDRIFIHNIITLKIGHIPKNDPIPEGWAKGKKPLKPRKKMIGAKWYINTITQKRKHFVPDTNVPEEWIATNLIQWIQHTETGEKQWIMRTDVVPAGWFKKRIYSPKKK